MTSTRPITSPVATASPSFTNGSASGLGRRKNVPGSGERTVRSAIVELLWLGKGGAHGVEAGAPLGAGLQRLLDADCAEVGLAVRLRLRDDIAVDADDRADGDVAAAGDGVVEEADRLDAAGHLDRAHRVADVHHVGGVAAGTERLLALHERELAAAVAVADAVGRGRHCPLALEERRAPLVGEAVVAQAHVDAQ